MKFTQYFKENFYEKLKTPSSNNPVRDRSDSMMFVFDRLEKLDSVYILESGCARLDHGEMNFGGDGASTFIFDSLMQFTKGHVLSVDINEQNVAYASSNTSAFTNIVCSDSVRFFNSIHHSRKYNLVYLDSMDVSNNEKSIHDSSLHHLMELMAVQKNLAQGCLVVIDDSDAFLDGSKRGKGTYIRQYFDRIGVAPVFDSYQLIYEMP